MPSGVIAGPHEKIANPKHDCKDEHGLARDPSTR